MKAGYGLVRTVSAVALSVGVAVSGGVAAQLAGITEAHAQVVNRVDVRGNQRVDAETIRNQIGFRPGRNFSNADIDEALRTLFATGLFSDVRINRVGGGLVVVVDEHSIVNQVIFQGNRRIRDPQLSSTVRLSPRGSFSNAMLQADVEAIRAAYGRVGRDDAEVNATVQQLDGNRVNVIFQINEGGRTRIRSINFVGNSAFGDRRLADIISTKRSNFLSVLTRNDIYDEQRLLADEEALRRFYYDRGYADFYVISSVGELDPERNEYNVTFTVDEGERYTFGDISIDSTIPGIDANALSPLLRTRSGSVYSARDVERSIIAVTERLAGQGYPFAQVNPRGDRDFANRTISVLYTIDQGPRAYVQRIEIRGNTKTRDYVIRREFDLNEGDAFNQVLIQRAKRRLEALDFFASVDIATAPGSAPDQVVLIVDVVEKSTGELSIGGGYTTGNTPESGFSIEGGIGERNFLGRGQSIRVSASGGGRARNYMLSFTEPYFLGRRISAGFDIYHQTRDYNTIGYTSALTGGSIRFGLPITENFSTQFSYNLTVERYDFHPDCITVACRNGIAVPIRDAIVQTATVGPWIKSSVSGSLVYNSIDNLQNPRDGIYANFTTEVAGLGGNAQWVKFTGRGSYYRTLSEELDLVGLLVGGAGHVEPYGNAPLRVFDYFQSNDRIIRGFAYNGIGPVDTTGAANYHLGGRTYFHGSAELQFPFPIVPDSLGFRGAVFAEAATLYGNSLPSANPASTPMHWRASAGASLIWASPFGPLRVDYAVPLAKQPTDLVQNFSFGISTRF